MSAKAKQDDIDLMADAAKAEIHSDAKANATALFGQRPHGMDDMAEAKFVEYVQRNWLPNPMVGDPPLPFRRWLLASRGADEFLRLYDEHVAPSQQAQQIANTGGVP